MRQKDLPRSSAKVSVFLDGTRHMWFFLKVHHSMNGPQTTPGSTGCTRGPASKKVEWASAKALPFQMRLKLQYINMNKLCRVFTHLKTFSVSTFHSLTLALSGLGPHRAGATAVSSLVFQSRAGAGGERHARVPQDLSLDHCDETILHNYILRRSKELNDLHTN